MIIDKEYPATHSMSTAWFIADKDGNVAIFDFDENGPVPCDIPQCSADSILEDDFLLPNELGIRNFNFDDNQSDLLIAYLKDAQKFDEYSRGYIVQIDVSQTNEFVQFASKYNYLLACYSRSKGLYLIDPCEALEHVNKMVEKGVVLKAAGIDAWDLSDNYDEENKTIKYVHDTFFEYFPFYLYQQPYWTAHLTERTFTPKYKFKLQQLNPRDQKRVLRLPISFDDFPKLQVAEFLPSSCTGSEYASIECGDFALLPLSDGKFQYVRIYFPSVAGFCRCYTDKPTILFIGKESDYDKLFAQDSILGMKSNSIFPYEKSCFDKSDPIRKSSGRLDETFIAQIKKMREDWWEYFSGFKDYWDQVFDIVNPYVVVIEDVIYEKVAQDLNVKGEKISILGMEYPYYLLSELNERKTEIESLAEQPYRGKKFLLTIDKEDMEKWVKENERDLSNYCSKRCPFCYNQSNPEGATAWQPSEVISFCKDCVNHGIKAVSLGGGEPFEYDGIFDVIDALYPITYTSVTTNGLPLLNQSVFKELLEHCPDKVHITIHNPDAQSEVLRVVEQVKELSRTNIKPGVNLLVSDNSIDACRETYAKLLEFLQPDQIILIPRRFGNTPTAKQLAFVAGNAPFQSPSCLLKCEIPEKFVSVSWDKKVNHCSYAGGKEPLQTLDYAGLLDALERVKFKSCLR